MQVEQSLTDTDVSFVPCLVAWTVHGTSLVPRPAEIQGEKSV